MSAPEATGVRQRSTKDEVPDESSTENPASLSANASKKVPRNKPVVKPPFADVTMGKFLTYLVLALGLLAAFYTWRFTVWAAEVGGYWNLVTGHRNPPATGLGEAAIKAAGAAASKASSHSSSKKSQPTGRGTGSVKSGDADIQGQIYSLANALGVKPADLNNAIRPLIDPTVPNPAEAARIEADALKAQLAQGGAGAAAASGGAEKTDEGPSLLSALGEALLD